MDEVKKIILGLHPLERKVLLELKNPATITQLISKTKLKDVEVMRAVQWLSNKKIAEINEETKDLVILGENGRIYRETGLPETRLLGCLNDEWQNIDDLKKKSKLKDDEVNICIGMLRQKAAIEIEKKEKIMLKITEQGKRFSSKASLEESFLKGDFPKNHENLCDEERFALENLLKRKDIVKKEKQKIVNVKLTEIGRNLITHKMDYDVVEKLTPEMLRTGAWKNKNFRRYDVKINVPKIFGGKKHFTIQAVEYIKKIWLEMGFEEMSGNQIQTAFWDLDALYVPQDHPARTMQDSFYIKDPAKGKLPKGIHEKIKAVHENGGESGSDGWQYKFNDEVAKENMLRTHTTVLSAQVISKLSEGDLPKKFFSVNKVFRNEALDWKHLFEFYQVEGIVVDKKANLRHLQGYLKEFYSKMGYPDVRMRPAHFPYTEPSMEIEVFHPVKKEWVELGGSGIFRPEVTKALMGFECPILAWGLGMPRIIASYFNINDIRELYKNDLKQIREMKMWMK